MRTRPWAARAAVGVAGISLIITGFACDKPAKPPEPPPAPASQPAPAAPTTASILSTPRQRLALLPLPFALQAPKNWSISHHGNDKVSLTLLDGQLVNGELHVILSERDTITAERYHIIADHVRKEQPKLEQAGGSVRLFDIGDARAIERIEMPAPTTQPVDPTDRLVDWRIDLYVPSGLKYDTYELKFLDMPEAVYRANHPMLETIFDSLTPIPMEPAPF
ncbi:MAG: hypothetical protein ACTHLZ_08415 [Tepidisphaeraceae bacterium]